MTADRYICTSLPKMHLEGSVVILYLTCDFSSQIHISKKWGFTKFNADEFEEMVAEKRLIPDGCGVKYIPNRGPLDKWRALHTA